MVVRCESEKALFPNSHGHLRMGCIDQEWMSITGCSERRGGCDQEAEEKRKLHSTKLAISLVENSLAAQKKLISNAGQHADAEHSHRAQQKPVFFS